MGRQNKFNLLGRIRNINWEALNLPPVEKDFYKEHEIVGQRSQSEIDQYITENEITLKGENIPRPIFEFNESTFPGINFFILH